MTSVPAILTTAPPLTPPPFGLLSAATLVDDPSLRWINGAEYDQHPRATLTVEGVAVDCSPVADPREITAGIPTVTDRALRVWAGVGCKLPGNEMATFEQRAREALTAGESAALERHLWNEAARPIMGDDTNILTPAAATVYAGFGEIEKWMYEVYGGVGVLHIPRYAVPLLVKVDQVRVDGSTLRTALGTPVAAGAYPGTDVEGGDPAAGKVWIAATGAMQYRRSPINIVPGFDHRSNQAQVFAERYYLPSWENQSAAALITLEV